MTAVSISRICPRPFSEVEAALADPGTFGRLEGGLIHAELEWHAGGTALVVPVTIELGEIEEAPAGVRVASIPIEIHSEEHRHMFPTFGGTAELVGTKSRCELTLVGRYRAPAGIGGLALDSALLHRVAEATLAAYLDGVVSRIVQSLAAQPPEPAEAAD